MLLYASIYQAHDVLVASWNSRFNPGQRVKDEPPCIFGKMGSAEGHILGVSRPCFSYAECYKGASHVRALQELGTVLDSGKVAIDFQDAIAALQ